MTPANNRKNIIEAVREAVKSGARTEMACKEIGLNVRTFQRWNKGNGGEDKRPMAIHVAENALTTEERQNVIDTCNSPEYRNLSPNVIVALLAEKGQYIASEATMYRILKEAVIK